MALVAVRVVGASAADEVRVLSSTCIETQRPRTTLKKSFEVDVVLGAELSTAECHEAATRASLREAVDNGRSVVVLALGSEKSGKSTSVRGGGDGSEGIALLTARDIFAALGEMSAQPDDVVAETMVTVSAALNAITPALGETALMGKQPVRERLVDALGPSSSEQPLAGLNIREHADGLPHAATFFAEGLREVEVKSAGAAEDIVRAAITRCAEEEAGLPLRVHLLVMFTLRQRRADGHERASQICVVDVAGVPRPRPVGGRGAAAGRGGGTAGRKGRGAPAGGAAVGEDPAVKALHRIIDTLQDARPGGHIPYRDSKLTRLLARSLGGDALLLPLVHLRADRHEEAEAMLLLSAKLQRLPSAAPAASSSALWWSPSAELGRCEQRACELAAALGLSREGLISGGVQLDHTSSDEMVALQEVLLRSERLEVRAHEWERMRADGGSAAGSARPSAARTDASARPVLLPPPLSSAASAPQQATAPGAAPAAALRELPPAVASLGAVDPSRLKLLKKAQPRRFVPAAGSRALAQHDNGEWYDARITATSRAEDGSARYVVKFDEDGLVQHLLLERLRAPNAA